MAPLKSTGLDDLLDRQRRANGRFGRRSRSGLLDYVALLNSNAAVALELARLYPRYRHDLDRAASAFTDLASRAVAFEATMGRGIWHGSNRLAEFYAEAGALIVQVDSAWRLIQLVLDRREQADEPDFDDERDED